MNWRTLAALVMGDVSHMRLHPLDFSPADRGRGTYSPVVAVRGTGWCLLWPVGCIRRSWVDAIAECAFEAGARRLASRE